MEWTLPGYMTIQVLAAWASVSPRTVRRWISQGLPTYQATVRGRVLIKPGDLDGFLKRNHVHDTALYAMVQQVLDDLQAEKL